MFALVFLLCVLPLWAAPCERLPEDNVHQASNAWVDDILATVKNFAGDLIDPITLPSQRVILGSSLLSRVELLNPVLRGLSSLKRVGNSSISSRNPLASGFWTISRFLLTNVTITSKLSYDSIIGSRDDADFSCVINSAELRVTTSTYQSAYHFQKIVWIHLKHECSITNIPGFGALASSFATEALSDVIRNLPF